MRKKTYKIYSFAILVIFSCIIFWNGFMRGSDFAWTVQQDRYWNTVLEMLLVYWLYLTVLLIPVNKNLWRYIWLVSVFLTLSFLHAFFYAIIVGALYIIMIYLTGYLLNKIIFRYDKNITRQFHFCIATGIGGIVLVVGIASALKVGTPQKLRILFLSIFIGELVLLRRSIKVVMGQWLTRIKVEKNRDENNKLKMIIALIITMITLVVCRANLGLDYDSIWYGLRSNFVLAPYTGIYDKVILMGCVYTYSKGIEVLTLPFAGLSTYSFIIAVNVVFCIMTLWAVYDLGSSTLPKEYSIIMALLVTLTPAIMNMAITAKSDTVTIYLQVVVLIYAVKTIKERKGIYLAMAFSTLLLSFGFKPSSIVFSTLIVTIIIIFSALLKVKIGVKNMKMLLISLGAIFVLWMRTWIITGYPLTSLLVPIFEKCGFYPKYPYTLPSANTMSVHELFTSGAIWGRLLRLFRIFFKPDAGDICTLEITWWGNLFTVLWIVSMIKIFLNPCKTFIKMKQDTIYAFQTIALVACSAVSVGCMLILSTPDGNYFMLMQILTYWFIMTEFAEQKYKIKKIVGVLSIPLVACNFLLCIAISTSWLVGATPIDLKNCGYYNHQKLYVEPCLESNSLNELREYLSQQCAAGKIRRIISFTGKDQIVHLLPAIIEECAQQQNWAPDTLASSNDLQKFMTYASVDNILIEKNYISTQEGYLNIITQLVQKGGLKIEYETNEYLLLSVGGNQKDDTTIQYFAKLLNQ